MNFFKRKIIPLFLILGFSLTAKAQCAMCRAVLESEADSTMAEGVNNGIIYLMVIPYILVGTLIWYIFKILKKSKQDHSKNSNS
ncbi:MAG: hypothetical protein WBG71_05875 [Leeuwenhoekiella sp.]